MIKTLTTTLTLAVATLVSPLAARANGYIYQILPVNEDGTTRVETEPLQPNQLARFAVRLYSPVKGGNRFRLHHTGSDYYTDWYSRRPKMAVYVSGVPVMAELEGVKNKTEDLTDFIFTYKVQAGDFAKPIRLADKDLKLITDTSEGTAYSYYLNVLNEVGPVWTIDNSTATDPATVTLTTAEFQFASSLPYAIVNPESTPYVQDHDLSQCNFQVETVKFDEKDVSASCWRSVHQGGTAMDEGGSTPSLHVSGTPTTSVKMYVWSTNEVAVKVADSAKGKKYDQVTYVQKDVTVAYGQPKVTVWMAVIDVIAGQQDYNFDIEGVTEGGEADLFLSAFPDFNYDLGAINKVRVQDYLVKRVRCTESLPPYASVRIEGESSFKLTPATGDAYNQRAATLQIQLNGTAYDGEVTVALTPSIPAAGDADAWKKYIGLSTYEEGGAHEQVTAVTFTKDEVAKGVVKQLQLYALGADSPLTVGPDPDHAVKFAVEVQGPAASHYDNAKGQGATLYLMQANPVVVAPTFGETLPPAQGGKNYGIALKVEDTYKNIAVPATDAGYKIYFTSGEKGVKETLVECPDTADKTWHFQADGTLKENDGELPVKYSVSGDYTSLIRVVGPDGRNSRYAGGTAAAPVEFKIKVTAPAMVTATADKKDYVEGEKAKVTFTLPADYPNPYGESDGAEDGAIWAFLKPNAETEKLVSGDAVIDDAGYAKKGIPIYQSEVTSDGSAIVTLLDGIEDGSRLRFTVVLSKSSEYDETDPDSLAKVIDDYQSKQLTVTVTNVRPTVTKVSMGASTVEWASPSDVPVFKSAVSKDVEKTFLMSVKEPGKLDLEALNMRWAVQEYTADDKEVISTDYFPYTGKPADKPFKYSFKTANGYAIVTLQAMDKDMAAELDDPWDEAPVYRFRVNISGNPSVSVVEDMQSFDEYVEGAGASRKITVRLSEGAVDDITVRATVYPYGKAEDGSDWDKVTDGEFLLDQTLAKDPGKPNVYTLVFKSGESLDNVLTFQELDGTLASQQKGFTVKLEVLTTTPNPDGKPYNEYYNAESARIYVINRAPKVIAPETNGPIDDKNKGYSVQVGANPAYAINFTIANDVQGDIDAGFKVRFICTGGGGTLDGAKYTDEVTITDLNTHKFIPSFDSQGAKTITLHIEDKDSKAGTEPFECTWYYDVAASKTLKLRPHGPHGGTASNGSSARYADIAGEGHVWANVLNPSVSGFDVSYNCGTAEKAEVYAFGYKVAKPADDGTLDDGRDIAIGPTGDAAGAGGPFYTYAGEKDSFFYRWLSISGGAADEKSSFGMMLSPEYGDRKAAVAEAPLVEQAAQDGAYPETVAEAIFAYEYRKEDNAGDINQDGIPDVLVRKYLDFGVVDSNGLLTGDDLADLSEFNEDEDYLPSAGKSAYAAFIPGLPEGWATEGEKFDAKREIRGYDENLNDALTQLGVIGVKPERVYVWTDADGNKVYSPLNCTISELEFFSWVSAGCDPTWSPERPTDPTKEDTDEDGLSDGYEYYFWYRAFVGDIEYFNAKETKGKFRRLIGHRYNPLHPESGDVIGWEEIAKAFDPLVKDTDVSTRDLDNDGLPDLLEFELGTNPIEWDTDGDGLPDGFEVMHGLDPLKEKTDGQNADGAANPDGDYMACATVPLTVIESYDSMNTKDFRPVYYATTRALTADDVEIKAVEEAKFWRVKVGGAYYVIPDEEGDKDALFTSFLNAAPEPEPEEGGEEVVANGAGLVIGGGGATKPSAEGWYLAKDLTEKDVFTAVALAEGDDTAFVRGAGARLVRGEKLDEEPVYLGTEEAPGSYAVKTLKVTLPATGSAEDFTNRGFTAWRYGKAGQFALGQSMEIAKGTPIVGEIMTDQSVLLLHHNVYQWRGFYLNEADAKKYGTLTVRKDMGTGFNPTTGWFRDKNTGCVNGRWASRSTAEFEPMQDCSGIRDMAGFGTAAYPGVAVDTVPYTTGDEFLLMNFRYNAGQIARDAMEPKANETMQAVWARETTLPVNGEDTFGADTDADGVPDGWELYVATGPSVNDSLGGAAMFSPLKGDDTDTVLETDWVTKQGWASDFTLVSKFAGTDTMIAYADVPSVADEKNLFNKRWLNKFWPLDPWSFDTDCDGIPDHQEGESATGDGDGGVNAWIYNGTEIAVHSGIYGTPTDDGSKCIAGGGMNPNSWDTDLDGLPDLWEGQSGMETQDLTHHGWYVSVTTGSGTNAVTTGSFQGGMDPTVKDSYTRLDEGVDRDYDHDGLQNWQEYMTGVIRAFRYDDALSPWTVPQWSNATGSDEMFLEALVTGKRLDPLTEGGSNPHLVFGKFDYLAAYGSQCRRPSDYACGYWYFFPDGPNHILRQGLVTPGDGCPYAAEVKAAGQSSKVVQTYGPAMYFTCSPTCADSDADGMDDYYELFHGMDPLYGGDNGRDLIALRWANGYPLNNVSAKNNLWTYTLKARGTSADAKLYDFAVYPWMAGDPAADPDGDDIRNVDEAIQANAQANETWLHTDPTPLWMTDSSDPNSLVSRYYGGIAASADPDLKDQYALAVPATVGEVELPYVMPLAGHRWGVCNDWRVPQVEKRMGYSFAFEENDGYDSDHDGLSDAREAHALATTASDPQDSDDPMRRQAMYFPGAKSALQARSDAVLGVDGKSELFFLEFTVECWVKPEDVSRAQTIVERVIRHPNSNPGDWNLYRRNFQLGIDENGHYFAAYDSNGTGTDRVTATAATPVAPNAWAHLAATYDGHELVLYVNGNPAFKQADNTHPATSAETIVSKTAETELGKIATESAIVMGASIAPTAPFFSLVAGKSTWANYDRFYKGYLDEVRVWDGARDGVAISDDYKARKRYTGADLLANREAVFAAWSAGVRRNLTDDIVNTAETGTLPPELVYHYTFDGLFGAVDESLVAQEPNGFSAPISAHGKAYAARPANWASPAWRDLSVHSLAYHNYAYVPWIPNLVAHLPPFDGTTLDSVYWSEDYAGAESAGSLGLRKFGFPRTSEPEVNFTPVQQDLLGFDPDSTRLAVIGGADKAFAFAKRARVLYATDLLPLGDAFVKFSTDFWDTTDDSDQGGSTITETSGQDNDFDNLPDWWEKLVADGDLATYSWKTEMTRDGVTRTAGEWFVLDTARGAHDTKTGGVLADPDFTAKSSVKGDGVPDWWKSLYGIDAAAADSDFDGLLNGVEYRVYAEKLLQGDSELSPVKNVTDGHVLDYYRKTVKWDYTNNCPAAAEVGPSLMGMMKPGVTKTGAAYPYAGFVLTDHDFIDDTWEDLFGADYISRYVYDAPRDKDRDGWSNWSEFLAGTAPDGSAKLSLVRSDGAEDHAVEHFPIPTLRATVSLDGDAKFDQDIVIKAWHGSSAVGEPDASWKVAGSGKVSAWSDRFLGLAPNRLVKFNIGPGDIGQSHVKLEFYDPNYWIEEVSSSDRKIILHNIDSSDWGVVYFGDDPADDSHGKDTGTMVGGFVNYRNGDIEIDFTNPTLRDTDYRFVEGGGESYKIYHYDLTRSFWRVSWMSRLTEIGNTKTFSLSRAETGHLRQGVNTFVAYIPDANGNYVPGAPLGVARNVDVGWDKVTDLSIALTANAGDWRFTAPGEGVRPVRIERTAVNGVATPARAIWASKADLSLRSWFTEADYVRSALGEYDLDWRWLAADAANAGVAADDISTADYRLIVDGAVVTNFARAFAVKRQAATAVEPSGNSYTVRTARPTFRWAGVSGMTAFELQVATDKEFKAEDIVWTSGTRMLPVIENGLRTFKSDCYVGEELEDGKVYFWRVAEMNAKWPSPGAWSVPAQFKTEVDSSGNTTGYGQLKADVRYYGVSGADMDKVVVGVYATADFTGLPVARKRLSATLGAKVSALAYSAPLGKSWMDTTANVTFDGIAPGRYYVMAFIDDNGNGQRDVWESWGYVNGIGKKVGSIFAPVEVEVVAGKPASVPALLCIDDTDVNDDDVPDCLQNGEDWENPDYGRPEVSRDVDTDNDGLSDYDEEYFYGTDLDKPDTDGDGMPDGWEVWAGTEPTYADGDKAAEGDVMAYAEISLKRITLEDGTELLLSEGETLGASKEADKYDGKLWSCYVYRPAAVVNGVEIPAVYGLGLPYTPTVGQVIKGQAADVKVALVHNQVYQYRRGYDVRTANPVAFAAGTAVDTKPFTTYDKYAVWAYLRAIGYTAETAEKEANWNAYTLKAGKADANDDLVDDGWQLYVMFSLGETFGKLGTKASVTAFTADRTLAGKTMTAGGEGLTWTQEYDNGRYPTDPWQKSTLKDTYTIDGVTYVISDKDAYDYHLKHYAGKEGDKYADFDNDGLANYDEYVLKMNGNHELDADKMFSYFGKVTIPSLTGQCVPDYFLKSLEINAEAAAAGYGTVKDYLGFDTTSHDFIESWWKDQYGLARTAFDPYGDADGDGWSNWAEARAFTDPTVEAKLSLVSAGAGEDNVLSAYPVPAVGVTVSVDSDKAASAGLVVRAWKGDDVSGIPDAEWKVAGNGEATVEHWRFLGMNPGKVVNLNLGPGTVAQGSIKLNFFDPSQYTVTEYKDTNGVVKASTTSWGNVDSAEWGGPLGFKDEPDEDGVIGTFIGGYVNYKTADITIDFGNPRWQVTDNSTGHNNMTESVHTHRNFSRSYVRVGWKSRLVTAGRIKSFTVSSADTDGTSKGHLREGLNTFVAFADANGNGEYDPGEAYGFVKDVDVGFDKVADLKIDLTASSPVLPRFDALAMAAPAEEGVEEEGVEEEEEANTDETAKAKSDTEIVVKSELPVITDLPENAYVSIVRELVNEQEMPTWCVVLKKKLDGDTVVTEADVLCKDSLDLDWGTLKQDSEAYADRQFPALKDITKVSYGVYVGSGNLLEMERVGWIEKTFSSVRAKATPVAPAATDTALVSETRPTFRWTMAKEGYTAFAFQMQTNGVTVYETVIPAPAKNAAGEYVFRPDLWFGDEMNTNAHLFANGDYTWRVAALNAKFCTADDWSDEAAFTVKLGDGKVLETDKGILDVTVRYYGAATVDAEHPIVVQAFKTADFTGVPEGQAIVTSTVLLASYDNTNAVNAKIYGLTAGDYYVRAFVDTTNDCTKSLWESWGYKNNVGSSKADLYTPVATAVGRNVTSAALVFVEDMDCNGDLIPDWMENFPVPYPAEAEADDDADPEVDSDGDFIPDVWEAVIGSNPLRPDADEAVKYDVMAKAFVGDVQVYVVTNVNGGVEATYAVRPGVHELGAEVRPSVYYTTFKMPFDDTLYIGAPTNFDRTAAAYLTVATNAVAIHGAVYDWFGFEPTTAWAPGGSNTVAFTAWDKYVTVAGYLPEFGVADCTSLKVGRIDGTNDGLPDGWELYVGFASDTREANPNLVSSKFPLAGAVLQTAVAEFDRAHDVADPWNKYFFYEQVHGKAEDAWKTDVRLYTNVEARRYDIVNGDTAVDSDQDGLANYDELQAKWDLALDLSVTNIFSNGTTPDYFRANAGVYAGEKYNGAEWIESEGRDVLGMIEDGLVRAGTRNYDNSGWDYWSVIRNGYDNEYAGVNDTDLTFVLRYLDAVVPGECSAKTLPELRDFVHEKWAGVERTAWNYTYNYDYSYSYTYDPETRTYNYERGDNDDEDTDTRMVLVGDQLVTLDEMISFFGGRTKMQTTIDSNKQAAALDEIALPEPQVDLVVRYTGDQKYVLLVDVYQVDPTYPENGLQRMAFWNTSAEFNAGVAKVPLSTPNAGSLKQGPARFVAYVDVNGNGKFDPADTFGMAEMNVGFAGGEVKITLGDQNPALPKIDVSSVSNATEGCRLAIVRSEINGQPLGENVAAVYVRGLENNLQREVLYPTEWVSESFIGVDRYFAEAEGIAKEMGFDHVHSVTYDVLVGCGTWDKSAYVSNAVQRFTVNYDAKRSIPKNLRFATATEGDVTFSFDLPEGDYPYTKFWMAVTDNATNETNVYGDARGFILPNAAGKVVTVDPKDYDINLTNSSYRVAFAIGNDKFGEPTEGDFCAALELDVNEARAYDGSYLVTVKHPTADLTGGNMTVAAYEAEDLANPVAVVTNADCASAIELGGLRAGKKYYLAAWHVADAGDGRPDATVRAPYDTWGYLCAFDQASACFTPFAVEAKEGGAPVTFYLQDTDWNDNGKIDREEALTTGITYPYAQPQESLDPEDPFWPVGPEPTPWNPVFPPEEGDDPSADTEDRWARGDVMAYADLEDVLLVKIGADEANAAWYAVMDLEGEGAKLRDSDIPEQTDASKIMSLMTTWSFDTVDAAVMDDEVIVGVGSAVTFAAGEKKVLKTRYAKVRLLHAQVYAKYGFETGCAAVCVDAADPRLEDGIARAEHPDTKAFTRKDKFLTVRYLEQIGVGDVNEKAALENPLDPVWDLYRYDCEMWWDTSRNRRDSDRDGVADGWELYTMYGTTDLAAFARSTRGILAAAKVSPFNAADGLLPAPGEAAMDADKRLTLVQEFDGGYYSTDPWSVDTDRDGVIDLYAYLYHLKGDDAGKDFDLDEEGNWVGDGLANYAEYLVSEVFRYAKLNPDVVKTDGACLDYFRKMGDLYLGEIFTDHDQVDDLWEAEYSTAANRYLYDPNRDDDNDGWSNYAEFRAGTDPTTDAENGVGGYTKNEYPVPVIEAKVVYNGKDVNLDSVVFKAWNEKTDPDMMSAPDAIWTIGNGEAAKPEGESLGGNPVSGSAETASTPVSYEKYLGKRTSGPRRLALGGGSVVEGSVAIKFFDANFKRLSSSNETAVADALWYVGATDRDGKLVDFRGNEIGTVDYKTGLATFDCAKLTGEAVGLPNSTDAWSQKLIVDKATADNTGGASYDVLTLDNADALIVWQAVNVGFSVNGNYLLSDADAVANGAKSHGHVREGKTTFVCYIAGADGAYVPGEPYGIVRGVDVGWQGAKFTVELSETDGMTDRVDLWTGADDRDATIDGSLMALMGDKTLQGLVMIAKENHATNELEYVAMLQSAISNRVYQQVAGENADKVRVRVVRYGIDDRFMYMTGVSQTGRNQYDQLVVFDKEFDRNGRSYVSEADFIGDGKFDIDWGTLSGTSYLAGAVVNGAGEPLGTTSAGPKGSGCSVTNMTYLIVLGDGPKDFLGSADTNTRVRVAGTITRRFDRVCATPKCEGVIGGGDLTPAGVVYTAHPTFVWSMPGEAEWTKRFGSSYTAFQLRIFDADKNLVYESEVTRAPAQDAEGRFTWTAPISVGGQTPQGKVFANHASYTWDVAMFNAKFMPGANAKWASPYAFSTSVNAQQPMDDAGFSSIGVTVKYTGPAATLFDGVAKVWLSDDLAKTNGKVRVQAFTTADFSGTPACEAVVADHVALFDTANVLANAELKGLAEGTYYIRAYIDSNGNFAKDDFESWGSAKEPVTVGPNVIRVPAVGLYIEDADTNGNWYPDAWEYQYLNKGQLPWEQIAGQKAAAPRANGEIVLAKAVYDQMVNGLAGISTGLSGTKVTIFQDAQYAELLLDPDYEWNETVETTFDAIRKAVEKKIVDKTLKITAITLDTKNSAVILAMDAEVDYANLVSGNLATRLYDLNAMNVPVDCTVTVKVYKKATLAQEGWELVDTVPKTFGKGETSVVVPVKDNGNEIDPSSGFYKVEVVQ